MILNDTILRFKFDPISSQSKNLVINCQKTKEHCKSELMLCLLVSFICNIYSKDLFYTCSEGIAFTS